MVRDDQLPRFGANYERQADGSLRLLDDPAKSLYRECSLFSGGGGPRPAIVRRRYRNAGITSSANRRMEASIFSCAM